MSLHVYTNYHIKRPVPIQELRAEEEGGLIIHQRLIICTIRYMYADDHYSGHLLNSCSLTTLECTSFVLGFRNSLFRPCINKGLDNSQQEHLSNHMTQPSL